MVAIWFGMGYELLAQPELDQLVKGMTRVDFKTNFDIFFPFLARTTRDVRMAREAFLEFLDHWKHLAKERCGNLVIIERLPKDQGYTGTVCGKPFSVLISPTVIGDRGFIEAILVSPKLVQGNFEISRFALDRNGNLVDLESPADLEYTDTTTSARIFMAIIKSVLEARAAVD